MEKDEQKQINRLLNEPPKLTLEEEIASSISHGIGAALAIPAFITMLINADSSSKMVSAFFYGIALFLFMLMSCLYHAFKRGTTVKRVFRRIMFSSIFLLFGGTFAPLYLVSFGDVLGITLFCVHWLFVILGITFVSVFGPGRTKGVQCGFYIAMTVGVFLFIPDWRSNNVNLLYLIFLGVALFVVGIILLFRKKKWTHFAWHIFSLMACAIQWIGIYLYIFCK